MTKPLPLERGHRVMQNDNGKRGTVISFTRGGHPIVQWDDWTFASDRRYLRKLPDRKEGLPRSKKDKGVERLRRPHNERGRIFDRPDRKEGA
jgi:hypothetical protein